MDVTTVPSRGARRIGPIRYAHAARFERPVPVSGVEDGVAARICPQSPPRLAAVMGPSQALAQGEDCLQLMVSTPACDRAGRPVMVFLHGGAFGAGAGLLDWYDGTALAAEADVVVVSVNYRLGVFGFLCLDGVSEPNLGLCDQIAALGWVRDHIRGFGGDPGRVTLFGQSAGALSIRLLLDAPGARGLFGRAILQSGPASYHARPRAEAEQIGAVFARHLAQDPRTAPVSALLAAAAATASTLAASGGVSVPPFYPVSGAEPIPDPGTAPLTGAAGLEILCGWNSDDASAFTHPDDPAVPTLTDQLFTVPITTFLDQLRAARARATGYRFTWRPPGSRYGATHGIELPLLLGHHRAWRHAPMLGTTPRHRIDRLGTQLRQTWGGFARTGARTAAPPRLTLL